MDSGGNNQYDVTVNVSDSGNKSDSREVDVTVENVQEGMTLTLKNLQPQVGTTFETELDEPDDVNDGDITWVWATSDSPNGSNPSTISGATGKSYRPLARDLAIGNVYLVVTANYTDGQGQAEDETVVSANPLKPADDSNSSPTFEQRNPQYTVTIDGDQEVGSGGFIPENSGNLPNPVVLTATDDEDDYDTDPNNENLRPDVLTFTIEGSDSNHFELIDRTSAQLRFTEGTMLDADSKSTYSVTVRATDPSGSTGTVKVTVTINDGNEAPVFTEGETVISYVENDDVDVQTYEADDPEGSTIGWTLAGNHASAFSISNRGVLTFNSPPSYEDATIPNLDDPNIPIAVPNPTVGGVAVRQYSVTIQAGDGINTTEREVDVNVTNEEEMGVISVDRLQPKVGVPIIATLSEPDGSTAGVVWQWATSTSSAEDGTWFDISPTDDSNNLVDGNDATYTPQEGNVGAYLRVTATYTDGHANMEDNPDTALDETRDITRTIITTAVIAADYTNELPKFPDQDPDMPGVQSDTTTRKVKEDASPGDSVGAAVIAKDPGPDGVTDEELFYRLYDVDDAAVDTAANKPTTFELNPDVDDDEFFVINSGTGQISVDSDEALNFEAQEEYRVAVTATDPNGSSSAPIFVTIEVLNVNESPSFGDEDQADKENLTSASYEEGGEATTTPVSTYTAADDENGADGATGQVLKWTLSGDDAAHFSICRGATVACPAPVAYEDGDRDPVPVYLRFKAVPDFEARADSNGDNVYNVTVEATDSANNKASRRVVITLENEEDAGTVSLSSIQPEAGSEIRAELTDPDGGTTGITWQWKFSGTRDGDYEDIVGATSDAYTPTTGDADGPGETYLRAVAMYTDAQGQDKVATSSPSNMPVQDEDADNQPPAFPDQNVNTPGTQTGQTRYVIEEVKGAPLVANKDGVTPPDSADPVMAALDTDDNPSTEADRKLTYSLGGSDRSLFTIASTTGQVSLRGSTMLDYESRTTYTVTVTATDPSLESATMTLTIEVVDDDERPTFSKKGLGVSGPGTVSHPENDTSDLATYKPEGSEAAGSSWSLEGADASDFSISSGGVLSFRSTPNFEAPADADSNNVYNVTVKATSGNITATRSVTVTVTNVDEGGTVNLSSPGNEVKVGVQLTAELDESDEEVVTGWQWARGASASGNFTNISGATDNTYTPDRRGRGQLPTDHGGLHRRQLRTGFAQRSDVSCGRGCNCDRARHRRLREPVADERPGERGLGHGHPDRPGQPDQPGLAVAEVRERFDQLVEHLRRDIGFVHNHRRRRGQLPARDGHVRRLLWHRSDFGRLHVQCGEAAQVRRQRER